MLADVLLQLQRDTAVLILCSMAWLEPVCDATSGLHDSKEHFPSVWPSGRMVLGHIFLNTLIYTRWVMWSVLPIIVFLVPNLIWVNLGDEVDVLFYFILFFLNFLPMSKMQVRRILICHCSFSLLWTSSRLILGKIMLWFQLNPPMNIGWTEIWGCQDKEMSFSAQRVKYE